ncbi:MAG: hypothetical protein ACLFP8_04710 [Alphaproteobacteria bacterium]
MRVVFLKYGLVFLALTLSAAALVYISQTVQRYERDISLYDQKIAQEEEKIKILKAEWAYLNNPQRLEVLATGGYSLQVPGVDSIISDPAHLSSLFSPKEEHLSSIMPAAGTQSEPDLSLHPQSPHSHKAGGLE